MEDVLKSFLSLKLMDSVYFLIFFVEHYKEVFFVHKLWIFTPYIFETLCSMIFDISNYKFCLSLIYQRFTLSGCKDIGIRKFWFFEKISSFSDKESLSCLLERYINETVVDGTNVSLRWCLLELWSFFKNLF